VKPVGTVTLKKGREKRIRNFYPWAQRGEVLRADSPGKGELVRLLDSEGAFLGIATYNATTRFQIRVLSQKDEPTDEAFFARRFSRAFDLRRQFDLDSNAARMVFSEADQLPGLIIDQFDRTQVLQVRSLGMEKLRDAWLPALIETSDVDGIFEKSDMSGREEESMKPRSECLYGDVPDEVTISEHGLEFRVPVKHGLKTGYYLDQRLTRERWESAIQPGEEVLDAFCYTGAFALHAARAGAKTTGVDIHPDAIRIARLNAKTNKLDATFIEANAFEWIEAGAEGKGPFDWILLDPPAIAKTSAKRDALKWAIWKLVFHSLPQLKPGGRLVVCNCSFQLSLSETIETCRLAAADRGERLFLEDVTLQDRDHPAPIWFPESLYLKCIWLRKESD